MDHRVSVWDRAHRGVAGAFVAPWLVASPADGLDFWLPMGFIITGLALFLWEMSMPGFFVAIPATVAIVLGTIGVFIDGFLTQEVWVLLVGILVAAPTTFITLRLYRRLAPPDAAPTTTTGESLAGRRGKVTVPVVPDTTKGKVRIDGVIWSARSEAATIPVGTTVEVLRSQGVHVVVRPIAAEAPPAPSAVPPPEEAEETA